MAFWARIWTDLGVLWTDYGENADLKKARDVILGKISDGLGREFGILSKISDGLGREFGILSKNLDGLGCAFGGLGREFGQTWEIT
jgi:hypothetical protein